ncbi:MAG: PQQ-binding-like beta-propeller repeat protein [Bryobacteraceae bacterium]|jgi:FOG: WD40-like repeat|nr:PQQ-binding-like beta-propeller repeat protein [Bryobacteraceae bacterium]
MSRLIVLALLFAAAGSADWVRFRGPNGSGVADVAKLPVDIGPDRNVAWRTELPAGHSSPVITKGRIFLTAAEGGQPRDAGLQKVVDEGGKLYTICLDAQTGKILWRREAPRPRIERYQPTNSPASPSPVTDGKNVYVFFGDFGLLAYDIDGKELWRLPLGPFNNVNGHGSSPILVDDLLIMLCDQDFGSYLLAVDKKSGRVRWKADRPDMTRSYSTPSVIRPKNGPPELIVPGSYQLTSYDARTGAKLWWISGLSWQPKSTPIIDGDMIFAHWWENGGEAAQPTETPTFEEILAKFDANGDRKISEAEFAPDPRLQRGLPNNDLDGDGLIDERDWNFYRARRASLNALLAVKYGGRGDLTGSRNIIWRMQKFLPNVPSPLLYRNVLYLIKDGGILTTVDPKTGRIFKQGRLPGALDIYYSSPVAGAGYVYLTSVNGKMTIIKAGEQWEIAGTADFDDQCYATPAIDGNALYVRTRSALYCFRAAE